MKTIKADTDSSGKFKLQNDDVPVFMVSIDMRHATRARFTVITEYIPEDLYEALSSMPVKKGYVDKNKKFHHYKGTLFCSHSDGEIEMGNESGVTVNKLAEAQNPNVPHVHIASFIARMMCEYDKGMLKDCIKYLLDFSEAVANVGVQDDKIMEHQNYALNLKALDKMDLVTSNKVPTTDVKNALPTLQGSYKITDIYKKVKKPLDHLIRVSYFVPQYGYDMHVFNNGVAKLRALSDQEKAKRKERFAKTHINWPTMQKIRLHQKQIAKVVKRPLHRNNK